MTTPRCRRAACAWSCRAGRKAAGDGIRTITGVASPLRLSANPPVLRNAPPALGQHTDEVLAELGLNTQAIAALRDKQVL